MNHLLKRLGAALLTLALTLTLFPAGAWAADPTTTYLALGDSITAGYTPDDGNGNPGVLSTPFTSYLKDLYGFEELDNSLAVSGWTSQSLLSGLQSAKEDTFAGVRLVTITIGGNDLMDALYGYLFEEYKKEPSYDATKYPDQEAFQAALAGGDMVLIKFAGNILPAFTTSDAFSNALARFKSNLEAILGLLPSDAVIVVCTQYNPYTYLRQQADDSTISGLLTLLGLYTPVVNLYNAFEAGCVELNDAISEVCNGRATVADVYDAFQDAQPAPAAGATPDYDNLCNAEIDTTSYSLQLDFHPNEAGHKVMAQTIAQTLNTQAVNLNAQAEVGSFAALTYGYTSPDSAKVTLTNNGLLPVTVTGVTCDNTQHFTVSQNTSSASIAPGSSAVVATLTPVIGLDARENYSTTVTVSLSAAYPDGEKATALGLTPASFTGSAQGDASLAVNSASLADALVTVDGTFTYTGQSLSPSAAVTLGGKTLTPGTDYTLSYTNNTNAGTATVTATGIGNYTDDASGTFTIRPARLTLDSVINAEKEYDGKTDGGSAAVTFGGLVNNETLTQGTDYTLAVTFDDPNAGTGKSGAVTVTLKETDTTKNYTFANGKTAEIKFNNGRIIKVAYTGTATAAGTIGAGESYTLALPELPEGAAYGDPSTTSDSQVTGLEVEDATLRYTGGQDVVAGNSYTVTIPVTGAVNYEDYDVTVTLTGCKILDLGADKTQIVTGPLEGVSGTQFDTADEVKAELSRVLVGNTGYTAANASFYDVTLQYWDSGTNAWVNATSDNFPAGGITVTLPYPDGTNSREYDFQVVHMFTVTSVRLGTTAGEIERPAVTETAEGLQVTLKGLSPVAVGWSKTPTGSSSDSHDKEEDSAPAAVATAAAVPAASLLPQTGDSSAIGLWVGVALAALAAIAGTVIYSRKNKK